MNGQFKPGTYTVTNKSKRPRTRGGMTFPGRGQSDASASTVEIVDARKHLQIRACRDLEVTPVATKKAGKGRSRRRTGDAASDVDEAAAETAEAEDTSDDSE